MSQLNGEVRRVDSVVDRSDWQMCPTVSQIAGRPMARQYLVRVPVGVVAKHATARAMPN